MHKNAALPERAEELQALLVCVLILGRPLARAAPLPPVVMALEEHLVDQADRARVEEPRDQVKLSPLHIHLHHHVVLLRYRLLQPLGEIKCLHAAHLAGHLLAGRGADAPHATATGLSLILLPRVAIDLEAERVILDPGGIGKQCDPLPCGVIRVERRVGLDGEHLEGVVLLGVLLPEPAADAGSVAARAEINVHVPALEADVGELWKVLDVLDVSLQRQPWLERLFQDQRLRVRQELHLVIPNCAVVG
uniref:Uncharacterized protein n=1 Tax=Triticum urartu TaxID=4572 RepID=A0A8R7PA99_TRIUA